MARKILLVDDEPLILKGLKYSLEQDGYLITSIPYDSHLEIKVDGREVVTEKVNTAFVGCRMVSGEHWVTLTYHAPGLFVGKWISLAGIVLWAGMWFLTEKCRKAEREDVRMSYRTLREIL